MGIRCLSQLDSPTQGPHGVLGLGRLCGVPSPPDTAMGKESKGE